MADNILVIKLGALGDFIYALGPMAAIRRAHPHDRITLLTTKPFAALGRNCGYFDEVLIDEKPSMGNVAGWLRLRRQLNAGDYKRVYDLQNNDRTAIYLRLFSKRPEWVGAARGASHRNADPMRSVGHAFHGHAQTLGLAGITDVTIDPLDWMKADLSALPLRAPYVLLVAGSSPQHPEKRWPVEHYRALAAKLLRNGYHPVLLGTQAEQDVNARIARGLDGVIDLTGRTGLTDLPALARGAAGAIGNDTGPIHILCVTGLPTLVLFCTRKSTIKKHGPQGAWVRAIESDDLASIGVQAVSDSFYDLLESARSKVSNSPTNGSAAL